MGCVIVGVEPGPRRLDRGSREALRTRGRQLVGRTGVRNARRVRGHGGDPRRMGRRRRWRRPWRGRPGDGGGSGDRLRTRRRVRRGHVAAGCLRREGRHSPVGAGRRRHEDRARDARVPQRGREGANGAASVTRPCREPKATGHLLASRCLACQRKGSRLLVGSTCQELDPVRPRIGPPGFSWHGPMCP